MSNASYNKFLMLIPNGVSPQGIDVRNHVPMGGISILAELNKDGYTTKLVDCIGEARRKHLLGIKDNYYTDYLVEDEMFRKTGLTDDEIFLEIDSFSPDVIGISCLTVVDRAETRRICNKIKSKFPHIPLIIGGHEASQSYKEILGQTEYDIEKIDTVDFVCVGYGQPIILNFMNYLNGKTKKKELKGVAYKEGGSVQFKPDDRLFNLNDYVLPDYNILPKINSIKTKQTIDIYSAVGNTHAGDLQNILHNNSEIKYFPLITSYGCGFHCSFCDTNRKLSRYSPTNVIKMIDHFDNLYGIDYVDFMDNNFGGGNSDSREIMFEILKRLEGRNLKIGFSNGLTFESMQRDNFSFLKALRRAGTIKHIAFPVENGNDRVLKMIRKPHTLNMVKEVFSFVKDYFDLSELNREGFFIGGFPTTSGLSAETPEELENTFKFIEKCYDENWLDQAIFLTLSPVTNTYRKQWREKYPNGSFEKALFSKGTKIWTYDNNLLIEMHQKVKELNKMKGKNKITRVL